MRRSHRAIPLLLASHWLWQPEGLQRCRSKTTGHLQPVFALITGDGHARLRAINTVNHTAIVTFPGQVRLDGTDHRHRIWIGGLIVSVIILVVVRIVIVPRIRPKPEAVVKNKEPIAEEMDMPPVPVAVPICIVTFDNTAHSSIERTTTESWSTAEAATAKTTTMEATSTGVSTPATTKTTTVESSSTGVSTTATTKTTTTESSSTAAVAS